MPPGLESGPIVPPMPVAGAAAGAPAPAVDSDLHAPIRRLAGLDVPSMPYSAVMEAYFMPSREKIVVAMRELAAY